MRKLARLVESIASNPQHAPRYAVTISPNRLSNS